MRIAAIAEFGSEHPLAQAIIAKAKKEGVEVIVFPDSFETLAGHGPQVVYSNQNIMIGNRKMMPYNNISIDANIETRLSQLEQDGKTAVLVSINNRLSGIIAIADTVKERAKEAIEELKIKESNQ